MSDKESIWPAQLHLRDTGIHDDLGGGGQRIYTTAGQGYEKRPYVLAEGMKLSLEHGHVCIRDEVGWLLWSAEVSAIPDEGAPVELKPRGSTVSGPLARRRQQPAEEAELGRWLLQLKEALDFRQKCRAQPANAVETGALRDALEWVEEAGKRVVDAAAREGVLPSRQR
jgi:hypothetical protein